MNSDLKSTNLLINTASIAVLLLCAGLYYVFWFAPLQEQQSDDEAQITRLQKLISAAHDTRSNAARLHNELKQLKARARDVRQRIPDQPEEATFLGLVSNAAKAHGLVIDDYRRGSASDRGAYWELEVTLHGRGTFEGICRFVKHLEGLPRQITIRSFQVNSPGADTTYPVQLSVLLYFGASQKEADRG